MPQDGELKLPVESAGVSFAKPYLINQDVDQDPETLALMQPYQVKRRQGFFADLPSSNVKCNH